MTFLLIGFFEKYFTYSNHKKIKAKLLSNGFLNMLGKWQILPHMPNISLPLIENVNKI